METEKEISNVLGPLVQRAHLTAKQNGFWNPKPSERRMLALMVTEVAELIEVDRQVDPKSSRMPDGWVEVVGTVEFIDFYKKHLKGTMGEEAADICIRMFDYIGGYHKSKMDLIWKSMYLELATWRGVKITDITELCFTITQRLCSIAQEHFKQSYCGEILAMCWVLCEQANIDILAHIQAKMAYNELREHKHGKRH